MKTLLTSLALVALAACATASSGPRTDWRCDNGAAFSVRFDGGEAVIFAGGQVYELPQVQSASGARYSNGAVEFWEHQGEATLNGAAGGTYANCRAS